MEPRVKYSLVGAFVLVFGALLIVGVLWLVKAGPQRTYRTYYAYFKESVSGLNKNAAVKYKGVNVGTVTNIELDPESLDQVRLTLAIDAGAPIKQDTVATLSMQGLTGLAFVELAGGSRESPPLKPTPSQPYPVIPTRPSLLMRLDEAATTLLSNVNQIAAGLADLSDEEGRETIRQILVNVAELTSALKEREDQLDQLFSSAGKTLENTRALTAKLPPLVDRVSETVVALERMAKQIGSASQSIERVVSGSQPDLQRFTAETLSETAKLVTELRQLTDTLQRVAQQVEANPRSLFFGRRPPAPGPGE